MDLYLASLLWLRGSEPRIEMTGDRAVFTFDPTDSLYETIHYYDSNKPVPVADFVRKVKILKGQMLDIKFSTVK
jgi:hypothetical protein